MAKKQTFTSKLSKQDSNFKYVKHIKSVISDDTGHTKFLENMVRLEENENLDQALKRMDEESKQVLSFGESLEEPKEEASAEEVKANEAPAEEPKEEAPAEEVKADEAPAEEAETATEDQSAEKAEESSDK
jgi:ribosomal protein S21